MLRAPLAVLVAAVCALTLAAPAGAAPREGRGSVGTYEGTEVPEQAKGFDDIVFSFKVRAKGRAVRVTDFTIAMNVVCSGFPLYTEYVVQPMNDMRVNRRTGRFRDVVAGTTESGTDYRVEVTGRLQGTRVRGGTLAYDVGVCQRGTGDDGPVAWKASRTSRR